MFVNLSASISFFRPAVEVVKQDKLKLLITCLAFGILFAGVAYGIYSHFWYQRQVEHESSLPLKSKSTTVFQHTYPLPQDKLARDRSASPDSPYSADFKSELPSECDPEVFSLNPKKTEQNLLTSPEEPLCTIPKERKQESRDLDLIDRVSAEIALQAKDENIHHQQTLETEEAEALTPEQLSEVEEFISDLMEDIEPKVKKEVYLEKMLAKEKKRHFYEDMFTRHEGVAAALKNDENKGQYSWINFCNRAFIDSHQNKKDHTSVGTLYIAIDPAQRYFVWDCLALRLSTTSLNIQGQLHSSPSTDQPGDVPGDGLKLQILATDLDHSIEWLNFLSLLANDFSENSIRLGHRPTTSGSESLQVQQRKVITCQGLLPYFSYSLDQSLLEKRDDPFKDLNLVSFS